MMFKSKYTLLVLALFLALGLTACSDEGPAEQAGAEIDEAVEDTAAFTEETAEDTVDVTENAMEQAGDEMEQAGDTIEQRTE